MTRATFPRAGSRPNTTARDARRRLPGDSVVFPHSDPATWLIAGAATAGLVAAAVFRPTRHAAVGGSVNLPAADNGVAK